MEILQYQGIRVKKSCDILRHLFYNLQNNSMLVSTICDTICRKVATKRVAKYMLQLTVKQLIIKMMSQHVATKTALNKLIFSMLNHTNAKKLCDILFTKFLLKISKLQKAKRKHKN